MQIKEIISKEEIAQSFFVLQEIYENLDEINYVENVLDLMKNGYKMAAVFKDEIIVGVVGISIISRLNLGRVLEIEDFMISRNYRGIGVGKMLLKWVDWQAMNFNCDHIIGNLQTKRRESQAIFAREKFIIEGFNFIKKC